MSSRFRGFLPVVIDFETGGFDPRRHALLEAAAVFVEFRGDRLTPSAQWQRAIVPYKGSQIEEASLKVTGIDPYASDRDAIPERTALESLFKTVRAKIKAAGCQRAIIVAHNASFDQQFLQQAIERNDMKRSPFHPFSTLDTAALSAIAFGHTVLSEACARAGIAFADDRAHNALYDAQRTAELFCEIVNRYPFDPSTLGNGIEAD